MSLQWLTAVMDPDDIAPQLLSATALILLMLFNTNRALCAVGEAAMDDDTAEDSFPSIAMDSNASRHMDLITTTALNQWRLFNTLALVDEDLGFWVKPKSTTWFTRFIMQEYDNARWIQMFCMTKRALLALAQHLLPTVKKKDTRYRAAVPVTVKVACTLFKLSHGATLLICS